MRFDEFWSGQRKGKKDGVESCRPVVVVFALRLNYRTVTVLVTIGLPLDVS